MSKYLWSVAIPTYNGARYLEETLLSVLAQDPGADKMEIILVDNRSTDDTVAIAQRIGQGRIRIVVNEHNVGVIGNFNRCIELSNGELVHILHADDTLKSGFYARIGEVFSKYSDVNLVCCNADLIDEHGNVIGSTTNIDSLAQPSNDVSEMLYKNPIVTPTVVVRAKAYELVGGFDTDLTFVSDWNMWLRIIHDLKGIYLDDSLAKYRIHAQNTTADLTATGSAVLDFEILFNKSMQLGYPIDKYKASAELKNMAKEYFVRFNYAQNTLAETKMLNLFKRHASLTEALSLVAMTALRKRLGKLKRTFLSGGK